MTKTFTTHEYSLDNIPIIALATSTVTHHELIRKFIPDAKFGPKTSGFNLLTVVDNQMGAALLRRRT